MNKINKYIFLWTLGGIIYYCIELLFRGFSHWSMFIVGGFCFLFIYIQGSILCWKDSIIVQIFRCTLFVMSVEFITGIIVNKWLHLNVWDYSEMPMHLFGQICMPFTLIFSVLCMIGILISSWLGYFLFGEEKPHYHIL